MKRFLSLCLLFIAAAVSAQDKSPFDIVKSGKYSYELLKVANSTINSFTSHMNLQGDGYFFRVKADSLHAEVPFVGSMTNPAPGMDTNAICVDSKMQNLKYRNSSNGKKLIVSFDVYSKHSHEKFSVMMTVTESGSADVTFRSGQRDPITFLGTIHDLE